MGEPEAPTAAESADRRADEIPNRETGIGLTSRGEPDTFEPEEDPDLEA